MLGKSSKPSNTKVHIKRIRATHPGQHVSYDKYQTVMSKLLRPKIHTYPSSTKLPNTILATPLSPHTYNTLSIDHHHIYSRLLNQNTHTHHTSNRRFRAKKIIAIFFFKVTEFTSADTSRFGPPPAISSRVGTPGCRNHPLSGSDEYHDDVGTPPLSIASDTRHSSPRTPHQCRTLARVHTVCNTARPPRSAKGYSPAL